MAAFYDAATRARLMELRPVPWSRRAAHRLLDPDGRTLARFELDLLRGRWICRDGDGRVVAHATIEPRWAALAALGRGLWARLMVFESQVGVEGEGASEAEVEHPGAVLHLRAPDFDDHHLLDVGGDPAHRFDARIALALSVLIG
jgi:hypothetical protein